MPKKYRALRLLAGFYRVIAWIACIGGVLLAILVAVVGLLPGRGPSSAALLSTPFAPRWMLGGPIAGLAMALGILIATAVQFVLAYAAAEVIELGLSIEQNTRETAYFLRAENELPAPPKPLPWDAPTQPPQ